MHMHVPWLCIHFTFYLRIYLQEIYKFELGNGLGTYVYKCKSPINIHIYEMAYRESWKQRTKNS